MMAINLGGNFNFNNQTSTQEIPVLNLKKNDILDLTKKEPGLQQVLLGAGWDVANNGQDFDLDISAFLLDQNNKVNSVENVVFFNNKSAQGVQLMGDNRTGFGDGDDETIQIDLTKVSSAIQKIVFVVTIADAQTKRQTFGMVNNAYVRLLDTQKNNREICRFDLREHGSTATAVIFAELFRSGADWQFKAIGEGRVADLNGILALYF